MSNNKTHFLATTLAQAWESFNEAIIPKAASAIQREEMRRAFYAGAGSFIACSLNTPNDPEGEAAAVAALSDEVDAFFDEMAALGKAISRQGGAHRA